MTTTPRPYETPWPFPGLPSKGDTVRYGSMQEVNVVDITPTLIILDNGRAFRR